MDFLIMKYFINMNKCHCNNHLNLYLTHTLKFNYVAIFDAIYTYIFNLFFIEG